MCVCLFCCRWTRRRWRDWCCSIHTSCSVQWCRTVRERWNEPIRWAGAPTHPRPPNTHTHTHMNMTPPQNHYHYYAVYSAFQHYAAETSILFDLNTNTFMHTWLWHAALHLFAFATYWVALNPSGAYSENTEKERRHFAFWMRRKSFLDHRIFASWHFPAALIIMTHLDVLFVILIIIRCDFH